MYVFAARGLIFKTITKVKLDDRRRVERWEDTHWEVEEITAFYDILMH